MSHENLEPAKQQLDTPSMQALYNKGFKVLGDFWTLHIIHVLAGGALGFNELLRSNPGISPSVLTNRMKRLEADGLVKRSVQTTGRPSTSYSLTDKGRGMMPILHEMYVFSEKFL